MASFNADALSLDAVHFPEFLEVLPKMLNFRSFVHLPDLTVFKLQIDGEQLEKTGDTSPQVELSQGCVVIGWLSPGCTITGSTLAVLPGSEQSSRLQERMFLTKNGFGQKTQFLTLLVSFFAPLDPFLAFLVEPIFLAFSEKIETLRISRL